MRPQAGGAVTQVAFREGDEVAAGQLLFTIDPRPYEAALAQAKANLARDRARLAEAGKTLERYKELVAKEYVTQRAVRPGAGERRGPRRRRSRGTRPPSSRRA